MANPAKPGKAKTPSAEETPERTALEDVLVALQKSFSRLSNLSRDVRPEDARALITGPVAFELNLRLVPEGSRLLHKADGDLQLKLSGTLRPDVRPRHPEEPSETPDTPSEP